MNMKKCKACPYHLGLIKCPISPCPQCMTSGSKKHPFPDEIIKSEYKPFKKG